VTCAKSSLTEIDNAFCSLPTGVVEQRQADHVSFDRMIQSFLGTVQRPKNEGTRLDQEDVLKKLAQIEEQAQFTLSEFPTLAKERLRMIIALARFLRAEIPSSGGQAPGKRPGDDDTLPRH
jgi:hypothetical protein